MIIYILIKYNLIKKILLDANLFLLSIIFLITSAITNISNTGCIIYPLQLTCYENFLWSVSRESIVELSQWYEIWSKAGAGPNFRIENPEIYIKGFNWIGGWIDRYFFKKVTDLPHFYNYLLLSAINKKISILFAEELRITYELEE